MKIINLFQFQFCFRNQCVNSPNSKNRSICSRFPLPLMKSTETEEMNLEKFKKSKKKLSSPICWLISVLKSNSSNQITLCGVFVGISIATKLKKKKANSHQHQHHHHHHHTIWWRIIMAPIIPSPFAMKTSALSSLSCCCPKRAGLVWSDKETYCYAKQCAL